MIENKNLKIQVEELTNLNKSLQLKLLKKENNWEENNGKQFKVQEPTYKKNKAVRIITFYKNHKSIKFKSYHLGNINFF